MVVFFLSVGGGLAGFIFAAPFIVCGIICFACKKNVGLWCTWVVYFLFDIYGSSHSYHTICSQEGRVGMSTVSVI